MEIDIGYRALNIIKYRHAAILYAQAIAGTRLHAKLRRSHYVVHTIYGISGGNIYIIS